MHLGFPKRHPSLSEYLAKGHAAVYSTELECLEQVDQQKKKKLFSNSFPVSLGTM